MLLAMARRLELRQRHVPDRFKQSAMVEPIDPFERRVLDRTDVLPGAATMDHFSLVESDDGFGQRVAVGIADAAIRRFDSGFGEPLGVANRQVLVAAVAVVDESGAGLASPQGLFKRRSRAI